MSIDLHYGWIKTDQAAAVPGLGFGPKHLTGQTRSGRLPGGPNNLMQKDIVFTAEGKGALDAIVGQMARMSIYSVRHGIFPGMQIEKMQESAFGGSDDEVIVEATESDTVTMPFNVYVLPDEPNTYSFGALVKQYGVGLTGFIPSSGGMVETARGIFDSVTTTYDQFAQFREGKTPLQKAMKGKKATVLITGARRVGAVPIVSYDREQPMPVIAQALKSAIAREAR